MNWYTTAKLKTKPMPKRKLGSTGKSIGLFSLGGQGSLETQGDKENCIQIIQRAYELGVNYFDTSPMYGPSEDYYGEALEGFRNKIFLATKSVERTRDEALRDIEKSLKRLRTDYIDLWQIHHLSKIPEVKQIMKKDGAMQAFQEMRDQKVVKFLGITGHERPLPLVSAINAFDFDTVLCPINAADPSMNPPFVDTVVAEANRKNMGIIGMKVFSQGFIFHPTGITTSWEPLAYAYSQPISTAIVGCDTVAQLEENIAITKTFEPLSEERMQEIVKSAKKYKRRASFFRSQYGGYKSRDELGEPYTLANFPV